MATELDYSYCCYPTVKLAPKNSPSNACQLSHLSVDPRNVKRHGTNKKAQRINRLAQLKRDLVTIYKYDPEVLASDKNLFDNPIDKLLTFSPDEIEKWIVFPPPHHSPKPPRGQTPQHMPCLPVTDVLPPATPFETKTANLTTQPTPPFDSHCQFSYHLVHASNPNYPHHTPTPSCSTSNQTSSPGSSSIRIPRIPAIVPPPLFHLLPQLISLRV